MYFSYVKDIIWGGQEGNLIDCLPPDPNARVEDLTLNVMVLRYGALGDDWV